MLSYWSTQLWVEWTLDNIQVKFVQRKRSKAVFFVEFLQNNFRYISVLGNQKHFFNNLFQMKSPFDAQKHSKHWIFWIFLVRFWRHLVCLPDWYNLHGLMAILECYFSTLDGLSVPPLYFLRFLLKGNSTFDNNLGRKSPSIHEYSGIIMRI